MNGRHADTGYLLVVSPTPWDASCTLVFGHLVDHGAPVRLVKYPGSDVASSLAGATAVVISRALFELADPVYCARKLGIPLYYFLDDNFMLLREEPDSARMHEEFSVGRLRCALRPFAGVLLSSKALIQYFRDHQLHDRLLFAPPACPSAPPVRPARSDRVSIGFFGGPHRVAPFLQFVYPAIRSLSRERALKLVVAGLDAGAVPTEPGIEVLHLPYDPVYNAAVRQFAEAGVDVVVHPSSVTTNNAYKTCNLLINARAFGAVPVAARVPPYDGLANEEVAILCDNTAEDWYRAIVSAATDVGLRERIQARLVVYCDEHFNPETNAQLFQSILDAHVAPDARTRAARLRRGGTCLTIRRLRGAAARHLGRAR